MHIIIYIYISPFFTFLIQVDLFLEKEVLPSLESYKPHLDGTARLEV